MSDEKPKVDPAYPSSDGLSAVGDVAISTIGATASWVVPFVEPAAQAILKKAIKLPLELRRTNWFNSLGEGLRELQDRFEGFDPDTLGENEEFVSTVAETTRIAMATHREEKLTALRNVVLNVAAGVRIDDVLHNTFLGYVDRFSGLHLKVLRLLANPSAVPAMVAAHQAVAIGGSLDRVLRAALPEIGDDDRLLLRTLSDLERESLTDGANARGMMSTSGLLAKRTSEFGDEFLRFIADPLKDPQAR